MRMLGHRPHDGEAIMAGGSHAQLVVCPVCLADSGTLTKAERTYEGDETDEYRCELGHSFGMDWSRGQASEPQWPPSAELRRRFQSAPPTKREGR